MWVKWRFGPYCKFSFVIWLLSEWDSDTHSIAIFFDSMQRVIVFHLFQVAELLAPLTFSAAITIEPASGGGDEYPPLSHRGRAS